MTISIREAMEKLEELSQRTFRNGETFDLLKNGKVVAVLSPPAAMQPKTGKESGGFFASRKRMFQSDAQAFADDVNGAIAEGNAASPRDPWQS
jgi:hypothetical protein